MSMLPLPNGKYITIAMLKCGMNDFLHFCPAAIQRLLMAYIEYKVKHPFFHNYKSSKTMTPPISKTANNIMKMAC